MRLAVSILTILILQYKEDLLATTLVVAPSDIVGLLEVWIDELASEFGDGLNEVELQWVFVSILDLQFGPGHVDVNPGFLALFLQLVDYFP